MEYDERAPITAGRRAVLAAAGGAGIAVALGGCSTYDFSGGGNPPPAEPGGSGAPAASGAPEPSDGASQGADGGGGGAPVLTEKSDIPVGGGKVFPDQQVVVTQPKAGEIKAFTAVCTHAGCIVANVNGGTINCNCHGSKYNIETGAVVNGPAPRPLAPRKINVKGNDISLG